MKRLIKHTPPPANAVSRLKQGVAVALAAAFGVLWTGAAFAQVSNQFINISPLPGGGIALNEQGRPDSRGAVYVNIPTAYTPGAGYVSVGGYRGDYDPDLSPFYSDPFGNGSAIVAAGMFGRPRTFFSIMYLSKVRDRALNMQWQLRDETDGLPSLAIGIQDIFRTERDNRSPYLVATKRFDVHGLPCYATLGFGWARFDEMPFGGVSASLNRHVSGILEFDGYQVNFGLGLRPFPNRGLSLLAGNNGFRSWVVGASATIQM